MKRAPAKNREFIPIHVSRMTLHHVKWGQIDPNDHEVIEKWFIEEFPKLPKKDLNAILDELMESNNEQSFDPGKIIYPVHIPLPLMKDTVPITGFLWGNIYRSFISYTQKLIKTSRGSKK